MEKILKYSTFSNLFTSNEAGLFAIVLCALVIMFYKWRGKNQKSAEIVSRALPGLRITPYSPYGHLKYAPKLTQLKEHGISPGITILDMMYGNALLFQKEGIFRFVVAYQENVVLIKPQYIQDLLTSTVFLEKGNQYDMLHPWLGTGLLTSHGSKWKTRRKLLTPSFHFDILKTFVPVFEEQSNALVGILKDKTHEDWVDIIQPITLCSLDIICETTLGVHVGAQRNRGSDYLQAVMKASKILVERGITPLYYLDVVFWRSSLGRKFKKELERLHGFTRKVIQEKKTAIISAQGKVQNSPGEQSVDEEPKRKRKALMDLLLDLHMKNPEFTEEDIREEIDTFAFEGHDTTAMGMCWALYLIGLYPEVQIQIQEELDVIYGDDHERPVTVEDLKEMTYLERVLKESQRLYPSVPFYSRKANQDLHFHGYRIKKGTQLVVCTPVVHRNPETFSNPEKFDPDRFLPENCAARHPFAYVPFSAGPRNCIGQRFAMMEEKTVISKVLRNFSIKSLDHRDRILVTPELVSRPVQSLKLKITPRPRSS